MKVLLLGAAAIVCASVWASTAGAAKPQTINLLEVGTVFVGMGGLDVNFNVPPKIGQGFVIGSDFYKWNGAKRGARVGTLNGTCTFVTDPTAPGGKTLCTAVANLPSGKITAIGVIPNTKTFRIPIVGGTGSYVGAQGYVEVTNGIGGDDSNKSNDKFVITG
jgi:hypothetical protein